MPSVLERKVILRLVADVAEAAGINQVAQTRDERVDFVLGNLVENGELVTREQVVEPALLLVILRVDPELLGDRLLLDQLLAQLHQLLVVPPLDVFHLKIALGGRQIGAIEQ